MAPQTTSFRGVRGLMTGFATAASSDGATQADASSLAACIQPLNLGRRESHGQRKANIMTFQMGVSSSSQTHASFVASAKLVVVSFENLLSLLIELKIKGRKAMKR